MSARARPLSPHLQIYRWQISNTLSIMHRITGVALAFGLVALAHWFISLAGGEEDYEAAMRLFSSPLGRLLLLGWIFAFFYHLLNGVRHLVWDAGYGFERSQRHASGWLVVAGAVVLTLCSAWMLWHGVGA